MTSVTIILCEKNFLPNSPRNDVWEKSAEIAYWWRFTTQIWFVLLIGWSRFPLGQNHQKHYRDRGSYTSSVERLRFTFTPNGKRDFVPRHQVFSLIVVNCLLLQLTKISSFTPVLYISSIVSFRPPRHFFLHFFWHLFVIIVIVWQINKYKYIRTVLDSFYMLILYSEKFSTWIWRFPFGVNVNLHLFSMEFLRAFPRYHFAGKPVVVLQNDGWFLRLKLPGNEKSLSHFSWQ